jgi:hypothetical protein
MSQHNRRKPLQTEIAILCAKPQQQQRKHHGPGLKRKGSSSTSALSSNTALGQRFIAISINRSERETTQRQQMQIYYVRIYISPPSSRSSRTEPPADKIFEDAAVR